MALENKESIEVKKMINGTKSEAEKEIKKIEQQSEVKVKLEFGKGTEKYLSWKDLFDYITQEKLI